MKNTAWQIYRTRFLIKARQLTEPLAFVDRLGREHHGEAGDYLIESSDGSRSIQRQGIFEDVYVPMGPMPPPACGCQSDVSPLAVRRRCVTDTHAWL